MFVRRGVCHVDCYTRKIKRTNDCIYTRSGETFRQLFRCESRGREFLTRRTKAFEGWRVAVGERWWNYINGLVRWSSWNGSLYAQSEREKEREGGRGKEKEKCHSDYYSFRPKRHRRNHTILLFRSREEDRRLDDLDRRTKDSADAWESCGKKMKEGGGMGRYGGKKADENWPGIDRDRWHLTWHLTNCEISLLRTGIIADQRSIYFSLPQYSLAPPPTRTRSQLEIQFLPSLSPVVRPSPRRIKRRKDGRPRKECDRLSASIALIEK